MGKQQLQQTIKAHGGYILSDGTCNLLHLLPKAYDLLVTYGIQAARLKQSILECFTPDTEYYATMEDAVRHNNSLFMCQYHGRVELSDDDETEYTWYEQVHNFFNELAPKGYYFGSSYGDGACIGWFKFEDEE